MTAAAGRPAMTFSFLELLDRTFRIYRENLVPIIGFVALVTVPLSIVSSIISFSTAQTSLNQLSRQPPNSGDLFAVCMGSMVTIVIAVVQAVLINGVLTYFTSEQHLGRRLTIGEAFQEARPRFGALGWGLVLLYIVIVIVFVAIGILTALCGIGIAGIGLAAYVGLATFAMLPPVLMLESVGASRGVNRAWTLGRSRFWTVLGFMAVFYIILLILNLALTSVAGLLVTPTRSFDITAGDMLNTVLTTVVSILLAPILPIGMTLLYYDVRSRVEGLDIALSTLDKPNPRPSDVPSPDPGALFTGRDLINVIILVVGVFVLSLVAAGLLTSIINQIVPGGLAGLR
jgi:hypothetical protein